MIKPYIPTEKELAVLAYQRFLHFEGDRDDIVDQDILIGYLVNAIKHFDYYYTYSDSLTVWRAGEANYAWITKHINHVNDPAIRSHLSQCFNPDKCHEVITPFPWGEYVVPGAKTNFVRFVFSGESIERAAYLSALKRELEAIRDEVWETGVQDRVLYADNYPVASKLLKEGLCWLNTETPLAPVAVTASLYTKLNLLGKLYKTNAVRFIDLKAVWPTRVQAMFDSRSEVIKIDNFYLMFTYNTKHPHN